MNSLEMKALHGKLLELLKDFDHLCRENGIEYTLHGGTLLGAVREHAFIPWDDDADVAMTRAAYEKLCQVLDDNSLDAYLHGTIKVQYRRKQDPDIWADIFICDDISEKPLLQKVKNAVLTVLDIMSRDRESMKYSKLDHYSKPKQWIYKIIFLFGQMISKKQKQTWYLKMSKEGLVGNRKYHIRSNDQYVGRKIVMPSAWMEEFIDLSFENTILRATKYYRELLQSSYGPDYMTPVEYEDCNMVHEQLRNSKELW